jgi:hypothetical protein
MDLVRGQVHLAKELNLHEMAVALGMPRRETVIFVQVERDYVLEGKPLFPM